MTPEAVVDSSVVLKWLVSEDDSPVALRLRGRFLFTAPDLLIAECSNALWKRVRRGELSKEGAQLGATLLGMAEFELVAMRALAVPAIELAIALDHPVYDCLFLALAVQKACPLITADQRLLGKLAGKHYPILTMAEAANF